MSDDRTKLLAACVDYRAMLDKLETENAALKAALDHQMNYQRELRADKDRLDWLANLDEKERLSFVLGWYRLAPKQVRREIDAAMKEGKE